MNSSLRGGPADEAIQGLQRRPGLLRFARNDEKNSPATITRTLTTYAEIGVTTNFSFLRGASHPQDYVHQGGLLGLKAIGIADHNTLAGVVRAYSELNNP